MNQVHGIHEACPMLLSRFFECVGGQWAASRSSMAELLSMVTVVFVAKKSLFAMNNFSRGGKIQLYLRNTKYLLPKYVVNV